MEMIIMENKSKLVITYKVYEEPEEPAKTYSEWAERNKWKVINKSLGGVINEYSCNGCGFDTSGYSVARGDITFNINEEMGDILTFRLCPRCFFNADKKLLDLIKKKCLEYSDERFKEYIGMLDNFEKAEK